MYGVGKPAPGWDVSTWISIINSGPEWKRRFYYLNMKIVVSGRGDLLPKGYAKESRHFDGEAWVESLVIPENHPIKQKMKLTVEQAKLLPPGVITKLVSMKYLVSETQLTKYFLFQERLDEMENVQRDVFQVAIEKLECIDEEFSNEELENVVTNFVDLYSHRPYDLKREQYDNLYDFEAIEALEAGNPLRVTCVDFPLIAKFWKREPPRTRYEEEGLRLWEWFQGAVERLVQGLPIDNPPVEVLEDDPLIIQEIGQMRTPFYFVITNDKKMLRKASRKVPAATIVHISCEDFVNIGNYDFDNPERVIEAIMPLYNIDSWEDLTLLVDSGSLETFLELRTEKNNVISTTSGIPWNKDIKRSAFSIKRDPTRLFPGRKDPLRIGYPQKGFAYKKY
jgi:hypothetical protein